MRNAGMGSSGYRGRQKETLTGETERYQRAFRSSVQRGDGPSINPSNIFHVSSAYTCTLIPMNFRCPPTTSTRATIAGCAIRVNRASYFSPISPSSYCRQMASIATSNIGTFNVAKTTELAWSASRSIGDNGFL